MAPWGQTYDNLCISIKTQKIPEKYNYTGKHKICTQITQPSLVKLLTITFCAYFRIGEKLRFQDVSTCFAIIDYNALVNTFWESSISSSPHAPPTLGESRNKKALFSWGPSPLGRVEIRNTSFLRKLNFLGSSSGQLFPLGEWWPRGWSCSPSNKFRAEFSGAYKWQDTAPPFPQPGLLESRGKVQITQTCKSSLKILHYYTFFPTQGKNPLQ